ncbi:MAG: FxDxF family PEP-CTERM protein [Sulfuritalea sp.]|nr:FxDxF family PEP-CTERM protein [Sulfuritalea sp.]
MKDRLLGLVGSVLASALFASTAQAQVVNGSFEANSQANGTWNIYSNLVGWQGGAFGIELRNNVAGAAYDGNNYIELDTTKNSLASQVLTTTPGSYILSFAYSARERINAASNGIEAWWNGSLVATLTGNGSNSGNSWGLYSYVVQGASPVSTLEFRAVGTSDSYGGSLDAVTVTAAVPEPETYAMMLAGLGLMAMVAKRRRRTLSA